MLSSARISFLLQVENDSEVKAKFDAVGGSIERLEEKTDGAAESAGRILKRYGDAATGLVDVAEKAFSLYTQFEGLEKAQLRVEKAQKAHERATLQLGRAQQALGELVDSGSESAGEYESALASVALAKEKERRASEGATQAQEDLAESQIRFALGVVPQVIGMASSASSAMSALGLSSVRAGAGAAAGAGGMATLRASLTSLWVALGPVGLAVVGIGAILTAISVNAFGFRDALNSIGKAAGDALPFLRPLLDMLGGISRWMEDMQGPAAAGAGSVGEFASQAEISLGRAEAAMAGLEGAMLGGMTSIGEAAEQVQTLAEYMQEMADSAEEAGRENLYFVQSTGAVADASGLSNAQLELAAGFLKEQQAQTRQLAQDNFGLVASHTSLQHALSLTNDQLARQAEKYRDVDKARNGGGKKKSSDPFDLFERATGRRPGRGAYVNESGNVVELHALGGTIYEPTLMLGMSSGRLGIMAEAGPETIVPAGARAGRNRPIMITVITTLDGREVARSVSRHQAENI